MAGSFATLQYGQQWAPLIISYRQTFHCKLNISNIFQSIKCDLCRRSEQQSHHDFLSPEDDLLLFLTFGLWILATTGLENLMAALMMQDAGPGGIIFMEQIRNCEDH